jgi:hypothetical protein
MGIGEGLGDAFMDCVKGIVDGEREWRSSNADEIADREAERRRLAYELFDGADRVDLVGHSTPRLCYLKLGDWVLDAAAAERLASYLPKSVKVVRLIGCATASTAEGRAAIAAFARFGLQAYGTLNKVYTTHFDRSGVKRGIEGPALLELLPGGRGAGPGTASGRGGLGALLRWLRRGARWATAALRGRLLRLLSGSAAPHAQISRLLGPAGIPMPGLLTDPLLTFEIASGESNEACWVLEILFDFEHARFYARGGAAAEREVIYEIRGAGWIAKTPLESYLERAPPGVALLHRDAEAGDRCGRVPRAVGRGGDRGGDRGGEPPAAGGSTPAGAGEHERAA